MLLQPPDRSTAIRIGTSIAIARDGKTLATTKSDSTTLSALERDELVRNYLPLVRHVVSRIAAGLPAHVDNEELFQVIRDLQQKKERTAFFKELKTTAAS